MPDTWDDDDDDDNEDEGPWEESEADEILAQAFAVADQDEQGAAVILSMDCHECGAGAYLLRAYSKAGLLVAKCPECGKPALRRALPIEFDELDFGKPD